VPNGYRALAWLNVSGYATRRRSAAKQRVVEDSLRQSSWSGLSSSSDAS
jgi:hypothetical protein